MENATEVLRDFIEQYRSDGGRNINPFSMRLQGIIDANVMGGIRKYQDAFFTERYIQSAEGKAEKANVQRLRSLMLKQVEILHVALELHGNLAPSDVQPLHKRLLEQFDEMKQSIIDMERVKRQFSESIINTPLPPVPVEKRSMSLSIAPSSDGNDDVIDDHSNYYMMSFEKEEIYTKPGQMNGTSTPISKSSTSVHRTMSAREQNGSITSDDISGSAPPVPMRPKSAGYGNYDSPEIPPKGKELYGNVSAPPLPPRGLPDTRHRISNPMLFNSSHSLDQENDLHTASAKTPQTYSVCVNIPIEDHPESDRFNAENYRYERSPQIDHRDSGISTNSHDLNYAFICGDLIRPPNGNGATNAGATENHNQVSANDSTDSNANENERVFASTPPPIPRKMTNSLNFSINQSNSDLFNHENGSDRQSNQTLTGTDTDEPDIDGYSMPKIPNNQ